MAPTRRLVLAWALVTVLVGCGSKAPGTPGAVLRLATTTSTRDSGLLDLLVPMFEKQRGCRVDVVAVGTGAALKLGETGDADVVLVHARKAEDAFMAAGHGIRREDVMWNTFEILGPAGDPAHAKGLSPEDALKAVAAAKAPFVSRGDESGTHKREKQLWQAAGGLTPWAGYVESGQGMGATLTMADQMKAYVLTDRGTYLKFRKRIDLAEIVTDGENLRNPYGVIVVNPKNGPGIDTSLAQAFADFLIAPSTQKAIGGYRLEGEVLFHPLHPAKPD